MIRQIVKKAAHFQRKEIIVPENIYLKQELNHIF